MTSTIPSSSPPSANHTTSALAPLHRNIPILPFTTPETLQHCLNYGLKYGFKYSSTEPSDPSTNIADSETPLPIIFIASYPKSGTTWMQAILFHMYHASVSASLVESHTQVLTHISEYSPFYELNSIWTNEGKISSKYYHNFTSLHCQLFNTHLLPTMLPITHKDSNIKSVYILRNARDVATSFYHHLQNQVMQDSSSQYESFFAFVVQWLDGNVIYGDWLSHVMDWVVASQNNPSILLIRYEMLLVEPHAIVDTICQHLNVRLDSEKMAYLLHKCSFTSMQMDIDKYQPISVQWRPGFEFIRKGVSGDDSLFSGLNLSEREVVLGRFIDMRARVVANANGVLCPQSINLLLSLLVFEELPQSSTNITS